MKAQGTRRLGERRGFAGILAITLLILVATTLAVVASSFSADARRTRVAIADAQLRQLLAVGALTATEHLRSGTISSERQTIDLPLELKDISATLAVSMSVANGTATVLVEAALEADHARQVLRFEQRDGDWSIAAAELH